MIEIKVKGLSTISSGLNKVRRKIQLDREKTLMAAAKTIKSRIATEVDRFAKDPTPKLRDSFEIVVEKSDVFGITGIAVRSELPYAAIQDRGGTVRAKNPSGFLTIPIHPDAKRKRARDFPGIFRPGGKRFLAVREGKDLKPLFALKESVVLPAQHYLDKALSKSTTAIQNLFNSLLKGAVNETR